MQGENQCSQRDIHGPLITKVDLKRGRNLSHRRSQTGPSHTKIKEQIQQLQQIDPAPFLDRGEIL